MAYTVSLTARAEADAYAAFERIRAVAPASAARWLTGLFAAIRTLADMPPAVYDTLAWFVPRLTQIIGILDN